MKKVFKDLSIYVRLHDGLRKPKINFQEMYKLFPGLIFEATPVFGSYQGFNEGYACKIYDMLVSDETGSTVSMVYREYTDADENLAYVG